MKVLVQIVGVTMVCYSLPRHTARILKVALAQRSTIMNEIGFDQRLRRSS